MTKKINEMSFEEMDDMYRKFGSFRACSREMGISHHTFIKYYNNRKNDVHNKNNEHVLTRDNSININIDSCDDRKCRIGLVSDTHIGSKYQQIYSLYEFYDKCEDEGVDVVLHAGDLSDGFGMYNGQVFELFALSERDQENYIVKHYPKIDGVKTIVIGGNHDESFWKKNGSDICYNVCNRRPDMQYNGFYISNININGVNIRLHHGDGGTAYARSYKPQRLAMSCIENENILNPDILVIGHYHSSCILPQFLGIYTVQMPGFQAQTPNYMGRKGLNPDIGGIILEVEKRSGSKKYTVTNTKYISYSTQDKF